MAQPPDFVKGTGPDQLPQGEAKQLNDQLASTPPPPDTAQPVAPQQQQQALPAAASPNDYQPQFTPQNEGDQFITGPTTRPNEPQTVGAHQQLPVPQAVLDAMPAFVEAAQAPDAPPQLQALVQLIQFHAGR